MRLPVGALIASAFVLLLAPAASADSFSLGVAAGEVSPNSATLWGHADQAGETRVEVATDVGFTNIVRSFKVQAQTANDLTVQRRVEGLQSSTPYWYRFTSGPATSDVGTFVTAPKTNDDASIKFAWTGDYDAESAVGQTQPFWNDFGVFRSMQAEGNDFNVALGDTIYSDSEVPRQAATRPRPHGRAEVGQVHAQPRPSAAGRPPWRRGLLLRHWDDHEFINDFSRFENVFQQWHDRWTAALRQRREGVHRLCAGRHTRSGNGLYRTPAVGQEPASSSSSTSVPSAPPRRARTASATTRRPRPAGPRTDGATSRPKRSSRS